MTEDEVKKIASQALKMTSAMHLRVSLALRQGDLWVILLSGRDQEWVVKAAAAEDPQRLRQQIAQEVQKLF